jgi:DNA-directed RNA polymerase specialized sigma subunit
VTHGYSAYTNHGCRCVICRAANAAVQRRWLQKPENRARHRIVRTASDRRRIRYRSRLALTLAPLIKRASLGKIAQIPDHDPAIDAEDFMQEAWIRALSVAQRFDPGRGVSLRSFAAPAVHGAIRDFLRKIDPLSRGDRDRVKRGELIAPTFVRLSEER